MKRTIPLSIAALLFVFLNSSFSCSALEDDIAGTWVGKCRFRIALDIELNESKELKITYYNLDGRIIPFEGEIEKNSETKAYTFLFDQLGVQFKGSLNSSGDTLDLLFITGAKEISVDFTKQHEVPEVTKRKNFVLPDGMNSNAPMELAMWSFLAGEWHGKHSKPIGGGATREFLLIWDGEWILDGNAMKNISKTWLLKATGEKGAMTQHGLDIRTYNSRLGEFEHTYTNAFSGKINKINWKIVGDEIHSYPSEWQGFEGYNMNIIKFRNISDDHFTWSIDKSFDKGETWKTDYIVIENVRVR